jgi:mRNA interferase YafQ
MNYDVVSTRLFRKQLKKTERQGKSRQKIRDVIYNLANGWSLPVSFNVHPLKGKFKGVYELHIEPDLLLIYRYNHNDHVLQLIQIGSHSELFE